MLLDHLGISQQNRLYKFFRTVNKEHSWPTELPESVYQPLKLRKFKEEVFPSKSLKGERSLDNAYWRNKHFEGAGND